jgi:transposase
MAMGKRKTCRQQPLFLSVTDLPRTPAHPFYERLNEILAQHRFDPFVEQVCQPFYATVLGRPSLEPGKYFRALFLGYFEGVDSERGIAWRVADSFSMREFVGYDRYELTADHSTLSRTRRLIDLETHSQVFQWVLTLLAKEGLIDGKTIGVDATTLEANAALRSIIRRDTKETYQEFLTRLAQASGIETPTREDLAKVDRERKNKGSNKDWEHPHDPDARIAKMKDGSTHLAYKAEHAVDLGEGAVGAVVAVTLVGADQGDTATLMPTLGQAAENLQSVAAVPEAVAQMHAERVREVVTDKGYHSNGSLLDLDESSTRSYVPEPDRGRRNFVGKQAEQKVVYANRRRIRGQRGKRLLRRRGEYVERSFAHIYETGGMRRLHLRERDNILKRLLIHVSGFNLSLVMRKLIGKGTPRGLQGLVGGVISLFWSLGLVLQALQDGLQSFRELRSNATVPNDRFTRSSPS